VLTHHAGVGSDTAHAGTTTDGRRERAVRRFCAWSLALTAGILLFICAGARAGSMNVWACHQPGGGVAPLDGWDSTITAPFIDNANTCAANGAGAFSTTILTASHPSHSYGSWKFSAPDSTKVVAFGYDRGGSVTGFASINVFGGLLPIYDSAHLKEVCRASAGCPTLATNHVDFPSLPNEAGMLLLTEACALSSTCDSGSHGSFSVTRAEVTLEDDSDPMFSNLGGALASGATLSGSASLSLQASDAGTGLYRIHTLVDGASIEDRVINANSGKCASITSGRDFLYTVPCATAAATSTTVDTTTLTEGSHHFTVKIEDAAGNLTTVLDSTATVDNVPLPAGGTPSVAGTLHNGQILTAKPGTWTNAGGGFTFSWLRCDSTGDDCTTVGAGTSYVLTLADVGKTIRLRVTAQNTAGEQAQATSAPTALVTEESQDATGHSDDDGHPPSSPTQGAKQPHPAGVPNGRNASVHALLSASFARGRTTLLVRAGAKRLRITGRLLNRETGAPIIGATIEQARRPGVAKAVEKQAPSVRTSGGGTFSIVLPHSAASQSVSFRYRASTTGAVTASTTVKLRVKTALSWRASSSRRTLQFTGRLSRPIPRRPRQYVEVQWRRGRTWATLAHPVAVAPNGTWKLRYRVGSNVQTGQRFQFRAAIRSTSAQYPYEANATKARWVSIR
jgi:hypothetical protein